LASLLVRLLKMVGLVAILCFSAMCVVSSVAAARRSNQFWVGGGGVAAAPPMVPPAIAAGGASPLSLPWTRPASSSAAESASVVGSISSIGAM
jgi:hypothetical protein